MSSSADTISLYFFTSMKFCQIASSLLLPFSTIAKRTAYTPRDLVGTPQDQAEALDGKLTFICEGEEEGEIAHSDFTFLSEHFCKKLEEQDLRPNKLFAWEYVFNRQAHEFSLIFKDHCFIIPDGPGPGRNQCEQALGDIWSSCTFDAQHVRC